jgi:hypothetical protein
VASLSYIDVLRLSGDVYMGGLMTVNELGLPLEFLHCEPLQPSRLQLSLYGTTIGRYLMVDVLGKGLIEGSQSRGVPVVLAREELLSLATRVKRPLCCLSATTQRPLSDAGDIKPRDNADDAKEFLAQLNETQPPYMLSIYDRISFPVEQHMRTLVDCASNFDILEPLNRIRRTLELLRGGEAQ